MCDREVAQPDGATRLAAAETPGLDPKTSITMARVEPVEAAERAPVEPLDPAGVLAIRSGYVPKLAELIAVAVRSRDGISLSMAGHPGA